MQADDRDLIIRALDDDLSAEETQRLQALLQSAPGARAEQEAHRSVRALVAEHGGQTYGPAFTDRVMDGLPSAEPRADRAPAASRRRITAWQRTGLALTAVVVLVGLSVLLGLWTQTVAVPYGQSDVVTLPDGSVVELSAGSTLRHVPFWWPGPRTVTLDGEAFFDVADGDDTFTVETFNARVVVTGTRFNVRAWRDDPVQHTTVALTEGRVDVMRSVPAAPPVTLRPGETSVVTPDTTETVSETERPLDRTLAWRSGGLAFDGQPLGSVLQELERRFALDITLADSALARRPLPHTYLNPQPPSAESVLTDICHFLNLRFQRTADGFVVLRNTASR